MSDKKLSKIKCGSCKKQIGIASVSAVNSRFKFYCGRECWQNKKHFLKTGENKRFHNIVDTSSYALKKLLGIPASEIPSDFRIAMFHVFKMRKIIKECAK